MLLKISDGAVLDVMDEFDQIQQAGEDSKFINPFAAPTTA